MVRRCGRSLGEFAFCTGGDVLAGCGALQATNDHAVLGKVAEELRNTYPSSLWTSKSIPWLHFPGSILPSCDSILNSRALLIVAALKICVRDIPALATLP